MYLGDNLAWGSVDVYILADGIPGSAQVERWTAHWVALRRAVIKFGLAVKRQGLCHFGSFRTSLVVVSHLAVNSEEGKSRKSSRERNSLVRSDCVSEVVACGGGKSTQHSVGIIE